MKKGSFLWIALAGSLQGQFSFDYIDAPGTGFFDTEARSPIGGNPGETLGAQRRNALERSAEIWEQFLDITGPIEIEASFNDFGCTAFSATLAGALASEMARNFPEAPESNTWYVGALANNLAGRDLFPNAPEIQVFVNSALDDEPACGDFYYGFDGNPPPGTSDFLRVAIHELGHGLGFVSLANVQTGALPLNTPDSYTRNLLDLPSGQTWDQLTNAQRANSATSQQLVWTGRNTQLASLNQIDTVFDSAVVFDDSEGQEPQIFLAPEASFGNSLPPQGITGELVVMNDGTAPITDACEDVPPENASNLAGRIVLIDRGTCLFTEKVLRAEAAGAIAVIVANNVSDEVLVMGGRAPFPTIPSVFVGQSSGLILRFLAEGAEVTLTQAEQEATSDGRPFMHAPATLSVGSSVSHFDSETDPDLLMEPFIGTNREDPDLAITIMRDIGWKLKDVPFPNLDYELWEEFFVQGTQGRNEDSDNDGFDNFSEYAFGSNPEDPNSHPNPLQFKNEGQTATLRYTRTDQATDLDFTLQSSENLTDGFPNSVEANSTVQETSVGLEEESLQIQTTNGTRFFRIQVEEK